MYHRISGVFIKNLTTSWFLSWCKLFTVTAPILIGWYPRHSTENVQFQLSTRAWKLHAKTVLNEGCASFAWVSHIKCCKCRDYSIVVMLCWYARVNVTTRLTLLDLDPSPSIIIILYHMRQLQVTQNLP